MVVTGLLLAGISAVAQVRVEPTGAVTGRVVWRGHERSGAGSEGAPGDGKGCEWGKEEHEG